MARSGAVSASLSSHTAAHTAESAPAAARSSDANWEKMAAPTARGPSSNAVACGDKRKRESRDGARPQLERC
eukprot:4642-Chlamydomonas_euryale.AAC.1